MPGLPERQHARGRSCVRDCVGPPRCPFQSLNDTMSRTLSGGAAVNRQLFPAIIVMTLLSLVLVSCQDGTSAPSDIGAVATASMSGPDGAPMGSVTLTQGPNGLLVSVDMTGLPPGWHGFHLHETGSCSPDFSAAGGHYSPGGHGHGFMHSSPHHPGDMPNIYAGFRWHGHRRCLQHKGGYRRGRGRDHIRFGRIRDHRPRQAGRLWRKPRRGRPHSLRRDHPQLMLVTR